MMALVFLGGNNALYLSFSLVTETVAESHRERYSVLMQIFFGTGVFFNAVFFYFLEHWKSALWVGYVLPVSLTLLGVIFLMKDTPMNIVVRHTPEQAY